MKRIAIVLVLAVTVLTTPICLTHDSQNNLSPYSGSTLIKMDGPQPPNEGY